MAPQAALVEAERSLDVCILSTQVKILLKKRCAIQSWLDSLPDHLRFSDQNLQVQKSMFETSSNTGAWCWCFMHMYHASCSLALNLVSKPPLLFLPALSPSGTHIMDDEVIALDIQSNLQLYSCHNSFFHGLVAS